MLSMARKGARLGLVFALLASFIPPVAAQTALDLSQFDSACRKNGTMLIGPISSDADPAVVLEPLCECISDQLSRFSQADVDMLASDLAGTATDLDRAAYGDYDGLVSRASAVVTACFSDPALLAPAKTQ